MPELLLEFLSEEIPARMQARAAEDLKRLVTEKLAAAGLSFSRAEAFATPRRLALVVEGLPERQPDRTEERKGPRVGAPDAAIQGFLKSVGLSSLGECEKRMIGKAEFWCSVVQHPGRSAVEVLPGLVADAIHSLAWPKSMRWGTTTFRWVRPLRNIMCVLDGERLDGQVIIGQISTYVPKLEKWFTGPEPMHFTNVSDGHRILSPASLRVTGFSDYQAKLRAAHVVLDARERERLIRDQALKLAAGKGLVLKEDPGLLAEVAGLVEWPVALIGRIDDRFLDLPPEVLTTSMRTHQRYFALQTKEGKLAPYFVVVANIEAADGGAAIVAGNERVLRARLSDARYFWDQDRKTRLEDRVPKLDQIVFHAKLGTVGERVARLQTLAAEIAELIPGCDRDLARSAALLAKADLVTGMVGEFPELQGTMGRFYALAERERPEVADAIAAHYSPKGPDDRVPTAPVSVAVALAEKIDTVVGMFLIGEKPTGSKDPYALRRAALGIARIIIENGLRIALTVPLASAVQGYIDQNRDEIIAIIDSKMPRDLSLEDTMKAALDIHRAQDFLRFLLDRVRVQLKDKGVRHDHLQAAFDVGRPGGGLEDDLVRLLDRVRALGAFLRSDDGANLLIAYRRAANIVRIEEKKDGARFAGRDYDAALAKAEEADLWQALTAAEKAIAASLVAERFAEAMAALAGLRRPVDAFFDKVTVNVEDAALRRNRLRLLARIAEVMNTVADFARIEG